jgi:hypothetical protein
MGFQKRFMALAIKGKLKKMSGLKDIENANFDINIKDDLISIVFEDGLIEKTSKVKYSENSGLAELLISRVRKLLKPDEFHRIIYNIDYENLKENIQCYFIKDGEKCFTETEEKL